jgi:mannose/fructose/N-acetylgalactosamine-specific phosphotransferase system component IID
MCRYLNSIGTKHALTGTNLGFFFFFFHISIYHSSVMSYDVPRGQQLGDKKKKKTGLRNIVKSIFNGDGKRKR